MRPSRPLVAVAAIAFAALALGGCASSSTKKDQQEARAAQQRELQPEAQINPTPPASPRRRAELHTDLAMGYYERLQMNVALQELAIAEKDDPTYPRIYSSYGLVYTMLGDAAKAQANFQKALSMAPNDSEIRHDWGAFLCTHGRPQESIAEFDFAVADPLYKSPEVALTNAGKCSEMIGNSGAAEAYFKRALSLKPSDASAAYNLALLKYKQGYYDEARSLMRIVMQTANPQPAALFLGHCIEQKQGDAQAEMSYVTQLRNRYPDSDEAKAINERCQ
ncbi:MAG: type IV pilus biogenesis/stability protein PilW [Proteobacteria bacterium]|nr:type IV pilus biogenesis/stability protein PilW [Pseudomonadota bacterium]